MNDIGSAGTRIRARATTSAALTEASLSAIEADNARVNAFMSVRADEARDAARQADVELAHGHDRGPLHGIPISIKDIIDVAGEITTAASHVLDDRRADRDATLVTRLREAGAIIIGRTNLHQFALGTTSEDSSRGPVRNPADPSRTPGGSSGGSAAAVATGMGLASIGTDTGGSIRIPGAACGLVGLKPTMGEVPTDGVIPLSPTLDHAGPIARSVQDAAWVYQVLSGQPLATMTATPLRGLRLTRLVGYFDGPFDPVVREAFTAAIDRLTRAGVIVHTATIAAAAEIPAAYMSIVLAEAAAWHATYLDTRASGYIPAVRDRLLSGRAIPAVQYLRARQTCLSLRDEVDALFGSCDALALPTMPIVAPPIGATEVVPDPADGSSLTVRAAMLKHTQLFNMTGHPAITLPLASMGLPVGLQLVGRRAATPQLLALAAACEAALAAAPSSARA